MALGSEQLSDEVKFRFLYENLANIFPELSYMLVILGSLINIMLGKSFASYPARPGIHYHSRLLITIFEKSCYLG